MRVKVYDIYNNVHTFPVRDLQHGRELAKRIIIEGLWFINDSGEEEFYPVHRIIKVKVTL